MTVSYEDYLDNLSDPPILGATDEPTTTEEEDVQQSFDGVKVFSATMLKERAMLGETVTDWLNEHRDYEIVDKVVTQSSDEAFHCLAITLFYKVPRR